MAEKKSVLILGGGFGGLRVALDLAKDKKFSVSLVDANYYHTFTPELLALIRASCNFQKKITLENVSGVVKIPFTDILKNKRINFYCGCVESLDLESHEVTIAKEKLSYDILVLALGSTTAYFNIPGAQDYSRPFKSLTDAIAVRNDLAEKLKSQEMVNVLIAGGGFTGVGLASSLATSSKLKITVVEGLENLLTGMPAWAQQKATEKLKKMGVNLVLNSKISEVKKDRIITETRKIPFDYLIWTTGVRGENLSDNIKGALINTKGQLEANPDLSLQNHPNVFAVGDLAGCSSPPAAWAALAQAAIVSENIKRMVTKKPARVFKLPAAYFIIPVTDSYSISNVFNLKITGLFATLLKKVVLLNYLLSILPPFMAIKYYMKGVTILDSNE